MQKNFQNRSPWGGRRNELADFGLKKTTKCFVQSGFFVHELKFSSIVCLKENTLIVVNADSPPKKQKMSFPSCGFPPLIKGGTITFLPKRNFWRVGAAKGGERKGNPEKCLDFLS